MADDVRVPAGWYPDPLGLPQLRWWDNHAWTEHTSDARQPMVAQDSAATRLAWADDDEPEAEATPTGPTDLPSRRELRERERLAYSAETAAETTFGPAAQTEPAGAAAGVDTAAAFGDPLRSLEAPARDQVATDQASPAARMASAGLIDDAPTSVRYDLDEEHEDLLGATPRAATAHASGGAASYVPEHTPEPRAAATRRRTAVSTAPHTSTGPVWIITVLPLYSLMVGMLVLLGGMDAGMSWLTVLLALGVPWIAGGVLAYVDRRMLLDAGVEEPAHWLWALGGPLVYLVARLIATVRETGAGFGPLLTHIVLGIFTLGAVVAVPGLLMIFAPATFANEAEISVIEDARSLGAELAVECPATPPLLVQQSFVCQATNDDGDTFQVRVSLQRSNGWIDWRVDDWGIFVL